MKRIDLKKLATLSLALFALSACNDSSMTAPSFDATVSGELADASAKKNARGTVSDVGTLSDASASAHSLVLVDRVSPLAEDVSISKVVGLAGAWVDFKQAGVKIFVPYGALETEVEITATALAGSKFAFDFQPHGLQFKQPVQVWFQKRKADIPAGPVVGAYFQGDVSSPEILETFFIFDNKSWLGLETDHFSGYALASA